MYEEQSLGVYRESEESEGESEFEPTGSRVTVWSRYLAMHARKQLAFDMWWLGLALFLVCIIEVCVHPPYSLQSFTSVQRPELDDVATMSYFNIFTIGRYSLNDRNTVFDLISLVFELVSAYGTVGLSLGLPYVCLTRLDVPNHALNVSHRRTIRSQAPSGRCQSSSFVS